MAALAVAAALLASGLYGTVTRGPTKPVCRIGESCSEPAVGAVLRFERAGRLVARVRVGAGGRYRIGLAPGVYAVGLLPPPALGNRIRPVRVHVRRGHVDRLDFAIDTGIR